MIVDFKLLLFVKSLDNPFDLKPFTRYQKSTLAKAKFQEKKDPGIKLKISLGLNLNKITLASCFHIKDI